MKEVVRLEKLKLEIKYLPINSIVGYVNNTRTHSQEQINQVKSSISEFGMVNPIGIHKNVILSGHCGWEALKQLDYKEVPTVDLSHLTEAQKKAYIIADNKLALNAGWDEELLKIELESLQELDFDLDILGFDSDELDDLLQIEEVIEEKKDSVNLSEKFLVPPFSVFDTKKDYWINRKKKWLEIIKDRGQARENVVANKNDGWDKRFSVISEISLLDPVLSEIINLWFAPEKNSNVFDCFSGDTVFGFVSSYLENNFTGVELREEQVEFNNNNTETNAKYICDDGRNVCKHIEKESQDLFFSCPPYFDLEVYSDKENDASNQETYEEFYSILDTAFSESIKCLKENRFAVVVAGDVRNKKTGEYYDFIGSIKETFKKNGMKLYNEIILLDRIGTAQLRAESYIRNRKVAKIHQNILVFYKGDTKKISEIFKEIEVMPFESENE